MGGSQALFVAALDSQTADFDGHELSQRGPAHADVQLLFRLRALGLAQREASGRQVAAGQPINRTII